MGAAVGKVLRKDPFQAIQQLYQRRQQVVQVAISKEAEFAHDQSVFGANLDQVPKIKVECLYDLREFGVEGEIEIPQVLLACMMFLLRNQRIKEKGLFRIPGDRYNILKLKQDISLMKDKPVTVDELENLKVITHTVANVMKTFLRELSEPLLTFQLYSEFIKQGKNPIENINYDELDKLLKQIPQNNREITWLLLAFIAEVSNHEQFTEMSPEALAIIFAPNMLRPKVEDMETLVQDSEPRKVVVLALIRYAKERNIKRLAD